MNEPKLPQLPFLTREMLKFGNKTPMRVRLSAASSIAGEVSLRAVTRHGIVQLNVTTSADGKVVADTVGIDDIPIIISVIDEGDSYKPNQCWANVSLEFNEEETISLCSGFVYVDKGITWPAAGLLDAVPGRGEFVEVQSADPAANAEATITVPDGELWRFLSFNLPLVTDANVADRVPHIVFTLPTAMTLNTWAAQAITASSTVLISGMIIGSVSGIVNDNDYIINLPQEMWLPPASTITTETLNLQATDNYGKMTALVEKFFAQA